MAITVAMRTQITELYVALFGRAPDAEGLGFWVQKLDAGTSLSSIADQMFATTPARAYYPSYLTNTEIITSFYVNVLGRSPDTDGLNFWLAKLNATGATPGSVITQMINVVMTYNGTDPAGIKSAHLFQNKVEIAQYFAEHVGTIAGSAAILSTITDDHATVIAAENAINTPVPVTFNLTTGVDNIDASGNNIVTATADLPITGVGTLTTGDIVKGNSSTVMNLTVNGTPGSLSTVANVGTININADATATVNADLWNGVGKVYLVAPTIAGTTTTLANASVSSVYGINGNSGNLTVTFRDTTGTADTAKVDLINAGTTANPVTVDVSTGNTIEGLQLYATGTNVVTINPGTADKAVTLTGDGTNTFTFGATAATLSFDGSLSTGTNKLTFAAGSIGAEDTIKGGTGADTVTANASTTFAHMTGVETFVTTVNGGVALYDGANVSGLTTMVINQGTAAGSELFSNMKAEFANLTINGPTGTQEIDYVTGANATLNLTYGPGTSAYDTTFNGLSVKNVETLNVTLNVGGVAGVNMGSGTIDLDKNVTHTLNLTQAGSDDSITMYVEKADSLQHLAMTASGDNSYLQVYVDVANDQTTQGLQTLDITASGISSEAVFQDWNYGALSSTNLMSLSRFTLTASGASSSAYMSDYVYSVGDMDLFSVKASGDNTYAEAYYKVWVSGDVGTLEVVASGNSSFASIDSYVTVTGSIGAINVLASGNYSSAEMNYDTYVYSGDVGAVNVTASGRDSYAYMDYLYIDSGNLGSLTVTASGASASATAYLSTIYGNVGSMTVTASGAYSTAYIYQYGYITGDVGSITVTASGASASASYYQDYAISGSVGSITVTASGASSSATYQAYSYIYGDVGSETVVASGDSAYAFLSHDGYTISGDVGPITVTASGGSASAYYEDGYVTGNVGAINVTASGGNSYAELTSLYASGNVQSVSVTASGSDSYASADLYNWDGSMTVFGANVAATGASAQAYLYVDAGTDGVLGNTTVSATKANSEADLWFYGNTFSSVAITTGSPSAYVLAHLDNETTSGGTVTASGSGKVDLYIDGKSVTSVNASGESNVVNVYVTNVAAATAGMTITGGSAADHLEGGKGVDTFTLGAGADVVSFANGVDAIAAVASVNTVTDIIASGFVSGADKLDFTTAGSGTNYAESLTAVASVTAFAAAADTALNGTVLYYFGVIANASAASGFDGYLAYDGNADGIVDGIIKLAGVADMGFGDII